MKKVLFITYYFPPAGGPGVQRVLKHIQYLPEFGWQPVVLTVQNGQYPSLDESLLATVPAGLEVIKTAILEPYSIYRRFVGLPDHIPVDVDNMKRVGEKRSVKQKVAEFVRSTFFIPDARIGWYLTAVAEGMRIIGSQKIDAIYNSGPPHTTSLIGRALHKKSGLPWVAGLRDPWTDFISSPERFGPSKAIEKWQEHAVFRDATAVECAWQGIIEDALAKYPDVNRNKFFHVPNGFDSGDFPPEVRRRLDPAAALPDLPSNPLFTITYTGSMYGRRNPEAFFRAFALAVNNGTIEPNKVKIRFVGRFGSEVQDMFKTFPWQESLEIVGYLPHEESIRYLVESDLLLLVVDETKESAAIVPGKVFEYVGTMVPVLAIAPTDGAIADIIRRTESGLVAHQTQTGEISTHLVQFFDAWRTRTRLVIPKRDVIRSYERRESARFLSSILDSVCS